MLSIAVLMLVAFTTAYQVTLPGWVWALFEEAIICLGFAYYAVWIRPPRQQQQQ